MKLLWPVLFCCLFWRWPAVQPPVRERPPETVHTVRIIHPGISATDSVAVRLTEHKSEAKAPTFSAPVASVVCGGNLCRVDTLRLYWNALGRFQHLELPAGVDLEKEGGRSFAAADYRKLDTILRNRNSILAGVYKWEIVGSAGGEGVDGITAATVALPTDAYVDGAVWTCYTLWHYAQGGVVDYIRQLSGGRKSLPELHTDLQSGPHDRQLLALEALTFRKFYTEPTVSLVIQAVLASPALQAPGMDYFAAAPPALRRAALLRLIAGGNAPLRLAALRLSAQQHENHSPGFSLDLARMVVAGGRYEEVSVLLELLPANPEPALVRELARLLTAEDFLAARLAYYYLSGQSLPASVRGRVNEFYAVNKARL